MPPIRHDADQVAEHQPLGSATTHDRANARRAALVGKVRVRAWLETHVAERHVKQLSGDSMPAFVNASAPTVVVVHERPTYRAMPPHDTSIRKPHKRPLTPVAHARFADNARALAPIKYVVPVLAFAFPPFLLLGLSWRGVTGLRLLGLLQYRFVLSRSNQRHDVQL